MTVRTQRTLANGLQSGTLQVECGVPQGSILGPLIFLLYINDIDSKNGGSKTRLYADDTVLYASHINPKTAAEIVQSALDRLVGWCEKNRLTINVKKTKGMLFGSKNKAHQTV